jgi:hypothetical protein
MAERSSDREFLDELASAHAELRQVKAALYAREGDGHVRAILDALPDSVKIYDEDRRLVYINPCASSCTRLRTSSRCGDLARQPSLQNI